MAASSIIFPLKTNLTVFDIEQAVVRDSNAVSVSAHVVEYLLWSGERALGIDYPLVFFPFCDMPGENESFAKSLQTPEKLQFPRIEWLLQGFQEQASEKLRQNADGQKEVRPARDPPLSIGRQPIAGHDTMQVRMKLEVLPPTVKHGEEADFRSQMLGIGGDDF